MYFKLHCHQFRPPLFQFLIH